MGPRVLLLLLVAVTIISQMRKMRLRKLSNLLKDLRLPKGRAGPRTGCEMLKAVKCPGYSRPLTILRTEASLTPSEGFFH